MRPGDRERSLPENQSPPVWGLSVLRRLPGFVIVGAIGFLVDAGILTALVTGFGAGHYVARAISFTVAVTATWYMNRRWVFDRVTAHKSSREYTSYLVVQVIGAVINLSIYVAVIELVPKLAETPVIPLALGAAVALLFNFGASSRFVFAEPRDRKVESGGFFR
jgi:putative flippase GtrA